MSTIKIVTHYRKLYAIIDGKKQRIGQYVGQRDVNAFQILEINTAFGGRRNVGIHCENKADVLVKAAQEVETFLKYGAKATTKRVKKS